MIYEILFCWTETFQFDCESSRWAISAQTSMTDACGYIYYYYPYLLFLGNYTKIFYKPVQLNGSQTVTQTFLRLVFLRLSLVLEAHGALVHFIRLHSKFATKAFGIICRFQTTIMQTRPNTDTRVRRGGGNEPF